MRTRPCFKDYIRGVVIFLLTVSLAIIFFVLGLMNKVYPIFSDFPEGDDVLIEYQYTDYMGFHHSGTIIDQLIIQDLRAVLKRIEEDNPKQIRMSEETTGAITFFFVVRNENGRLGYSMKGDVLAVGKGGKLLKFYTMYQLNQSHAEELISYLRMIFD